VSVSNLYLNYITISSKTDSALIGIVAGYVNGTMTSVGVLHACIKSSNGTKSLMTSLSQTSLIGKSATGVSIQSSYKSSDNNEEEKENGQGFGGSIDMYTLNRRFTYMFGKLAALGSAVDAVGNGWGLGLYNTKTQNYNATLYQMNDYYMYVTENDVSLPASGTSRKRGFLAACSYIPLNVDTTAMFNTESTKTVSGTYSAYGYSKTVSLTTYSTEYYEKHEAEAVLNSNTGYIVTGSENSQYKSISLSYIIGREAAVSNSIQTKTENGNLKVDYLKIYNINSGGEKLIEDEVNKDGIASEMNRTKNKLTATLMDASSLNRYTAVRDQYISSLNSTASATSNQALIISAFQYQEAVNTKNYLQVSTDEQYPIYLADKKYTSYQFLAASVNFSLKKSGYITTIMGNTTNTAGRATMFNLYSVERNESAQITSVKQITEAYADSDNNILNKYSDGTYSSKDTSIAQESNLVYSSNWYSSLELSANTLYYVEIPVIAGDYAIGNSQDAYGAFFFYLDVGANGSSTEGEKDKDEDTVTYVVKDVNFVTSLPVGDWSKFPIITIQIDITDTLKAAACFYFLRVNNGTDTMYCYYSYGATNLTVKDVDIDKSITDVEITNYYSTTDGLNSDVIWTSTTTTPS
jgi:hypothetical protein